ncbi:transcriptional regulator [Pilimelia terevasa]|uniref:Transcriptional regulator n=1 Tax=Pilimelia terevasa TaxID=53372 RepID=A0A8J3BKY8_9ACTN|nr:GntR family transcriptional regulator [Pilimelia terevasa]GGK29860.1 transcriptional regulator [Pilimelia terevasa]
MSQPIDRRADRPVYKQLADDLRRRILAGEFPHGGPLPSEAQLSLEYDAVSRTMVRQGLTLLKNEGLVSSQHGRGWYVRRHREVRRMASTRYQAELDQVARAAETRDSTPFHYDHRDFERFTLDKRGEDVPADAELAEVFDVPEGTVLFRRTFTFHFDGEPHRRSYSYLLRDMFDGTAVLDVANEPWPGGTMAQLDLVGVRVTAVDEIVNARMPTPEESRALQIDDGVPVLAVRRLMYAGERVVEACVDIVIPADRVSLHYRTELSDPRPPA